MKIKLDENVVREAVAVLRELDHDVTTVPEEDMSGWSDDDIRPVIQAEARFLVTFDKGFGDIRRYASGSHRGVLLLRPDKHRPAAVAAFIKDVLQTVVLEDIEGCIAVATPRGIRIRRPPR